MPNVPGRLFPPRRVPPEGEVDLRAPISAFGRYDLLEKIGEGSFSEVFVARSDGFEGLFRLSALKRMKAALCSDVDLVSRFIEEARLAVRVEHAGTVGVDDFGRVGGVYFIAFELVDGVTLEDVLAKTLARGIVIDPRAAAWIARAVAAAVDAVHKTKGADGAPLKLVHGDLQPKNVMIARDGKVKVKSFAAPSIFGDDLDDLTSAVGVAGLAHQAPEVLAGAQPTPAADVWSLGVLLFQLLVGSRPFEGATFDEVVAAVRTVPPSPPSARRAGVPSILDAAVDEALVRPLAERPADAAAWAGSLDEYLRGAGYDAAAFANTLRDLDDEDFRGGALASTPTRVQRVSRTSRPSASSSSTASADAAQSGPAPVAAPSPFSRATPLSSPQSVGGLEARPGEQPAKAPAPSPAREGRASPMPSAPAPVALATGPMLRGQLAEQLHKDPGPWGLVRLAERTANDGRALDEARAMFRSAAIMFASRGLLAHALCAYDGARAALSGDDVTFDLTKLAELGGGNLALRQQELRRVGGLPYLEALRAQTDGVDRGAAGVGNVATPFLSALQPAAFARLGQLSRVRRAPAGSYVLREGEPGDSLFAVGEGRLVVTCTPSQIDLGVENVGVDLEPKGDEFDEHTDPGFGIKRVSGVVVAPGLEDELGALESRSQDRGAPVIADPHARRVFLSALTAGDLFGEFSFLTGRPRSASVEAVTSCRLVEITRRAVGGLLEEHLELRDALEAFYKERVLEWMLAKNEVFSLLEPDARRSLLSQCGVYDIPAGKIVVREGELHDAMYFIKRGEVEVTTEDNGLEVFINKLGAGEFFGEIAALEGGPRRASVRAVTELEVFRITRTDLQIVLADAPDVRARLEKAMRARSAEIRARIAEQRSVLGST